MKNHLIVRSSGNSDHSLFSFSDALVGFDLIAEASWFPFPIGKTGRIFFIETRDGQDRNFILDGDRPRQIEVPFHSPPDMCFPELGLGWRRDGGLAIVPESGDGRRMKIEIPKDFKPYGFVEEHGKTFALVIIEGSGVVSLMRSDGTMVKNRQWDAVCACPFGRSSVASLSPDKRSISIHSLIGEEKRTEGVGSDLNGEVLDWWRPMVSNEEDISIGFGLRTMVVNVKGRKVDIINGIHCTPSSIDVVEPDSSWFECTPEREEAPRVSVVIPSKTDIVDEDDGKYTIGFLDCEWTHEPIVILSAASWFATGGNQRPAALAKQFNRLGKFVIYYAPPNPINGIVDGVLITNNPNMLDDIMGVCQGTAYCSFGRFAHLVESFSKRGWKIAYDMIDDWDGLVHSGFVPGGEDLLDQERFILDAADLVICSAPFLIERVSRLSRRKTPYLVLNGGPHPLTPPITPPHDMIVDREFSSVYCGFLGAPWIDEECFRLISRHDDISCMVIGGHSTQEMSGVRFVGEKNFDEAMRYVSSADVGLIPFKNEEICRGVDPIKAYDYWAAGLWVVATPDLRFMHDRPFTIISRISDFPDAIREAKQKREESPVEASFVEENTWENRAKRILGLISGERIEELPKEVRIDEVSRNEPLIWTLPTYEDEAPGSNLRLMWVASDSCNMGCSYRIARGAFAKREQEGRGKTWTISDATRSWEGVRDEFGMCLVEMSGMEITVVPETIGVVNQCGHYAQLSSNISVNPRRLLDAGAIPSLTSIATSFHPEGWNHDIDRFIRQIRSYESLGFHILGTSIVGHPKFIDSIPGWADRFEDEGVYCIVHVMKGTHEGRPIPEEYTAHELEIVKRYSPPSKIQNYLNQNEALEQMETCAAGWLYAQICIDGTVVRCDVYNYMEDRYGTGMDESHNFFRDGLIMNQGPKGCRPMSDGHYCPCENYYRYQIPKGAIVSR